jgi:hypothetical protein
VERESAAGGKETVTRSRTVEAVPEVLDPTDKAVDPVPEAAARAPEVEGKSGVGGRSR